MQLKFSLFSFFIFIAQALSSDIIHLGRDLKLTFPFASDPNLRPTDAPFISGNTYRSIANWCLDETDIPIDTDKVKKGDIIYVKGAIVDNFLCYVHPLINTPYILLSCDADHSNATQNRIQSIDSDKIIVLGCVNCLLPSHPKVIPIPLGVPNGSAINFPKKNDYLNIISRNLPKETQCTAIFAGNSHPRREYVNTIIANKPFIKKLPYIPPTIYLETMAKSDFCISPRGAGLDCFRTWEALLFDCIPIVESCSLDTLFYELPVLIIDDYINLTLEKLLEFKHPVNSKKHEFKMEKIYANYWTNFFLELQKVVRAEENFEQFIGEFKTKTFGSNFSNWEK